MLAATQLVPTRLHKTIPEKHSDNRPRSPCLREFLKLPATAARRWRA
jgi:hypothetical protein